MAKIKEKTEELLSFLKGGFQEKINTRNYVNEEPLRAELFTFAQLSQYGKELAGKHKLSTKRKQDKLLGRLADNEKILLEVRALLTNSDNTTFKITPAGEWLIDNFYLIEEQIRTAKKHLPKDYSENLPQLENGKSAGFSRVYDIAIQIVSHSDGWINEESLSSFVNSYQTITHLKLGELWAIPIMLRLALIENLRRVSLGIAIDRVNRNMADYWAKKMIETSENNPKDLINTIAEMTRSHPPLVGPFIAELTHQLSGKGPGLALALSWIEQRLSEMGSTSIELIALENQKQAVNQVSMKNGITSLRTLSAIDWRDFIESHSIVEQTLREDPAQVYSNMDFSTRDRYRHVVENVSAESKLSEEQVARIVLRLSQQKTATKVNSERASHVGYYLLDKGILETNKQANISKSFLIIVKDILRSSRFIIYFANILLITLIATTIIFLAIRKEETSNVLLFSVIILSLITTSQLAITLFNFVVTLFVKPGLLSRMDFSKEIPDDYHTLVIIPVMLTNATEIENLVEALEVRFLANRDNNLRFGLLTDFTDASSETLPEDDALVNYACAKINDLNKKYGQASAALFYLFHRPRRWNAADKIWMGYERKRGKLLELNALLRGRDKDRFSVIIGNTDDLLRVKYVITLDADTQLPRGTAWKLIATMAHPLNTAFYNEKKQIVTHGYGILQPRVTVSLPEVTASHYAKLHGNEPGIDPYTRATSDVYQDLFGEGSFIGKGIYEVDIFEKVLCGKFPDNRILSHDLLEGCYTRSGLISDVQLYEKYPSTYVADVKRRARWIRGDWQIAAWATPFVPDAAGKLKRNPLSALSRWKIFDNVRRSVFPIALTIFILLGWIVLDHPLFWTLAVSGIIVLPIFVTSIWNFLRKPKDIVFTQHIVFTSINVAEAFVTTIFTLICLPHEAFYSLVSIIRTKWRLFVSHKKLLEWNPSAMENNSNPISLINSYFSMWAEVLLAFITFTFLVIYFPERLDIAGPILLLWVLSPIAIWWSSQPITKQTSQLTTSQLIFLRVMARKTWAFFERFVTAEDNWLPPDNFQEKPAPVIAHRTSPTNIGLYLLSNLSACDFGYQTTDQFLKRTEKSIDTLNKLDKYRGHLFNWYDTKTLQPLIPKYISTVDSGNLVGQVLTLKHGLLEILDQKIVEPRLFKGLEDTLRALVDSIKHKKPESLKDFKVALHKASHQPLDNITEVLNSLENLSVLFFKASQELPDESEELVCWWQKTMTEQLDAAILEIKILEPIRLFSSSAPEEYRSLLRDLNQNPSIKEIIQIADNLLAEINSINSTQHTSENKEWQDKLTSAFTESIRIANERIELIEQLSSSCDKLANVDWDFLYDEQKHLLSIGYRPKEYQCDTSFYDLLASEVRLGVFVAIAQGKLPEESWFALGRLVTNPGRAPVLLSWSGSMFEYLMPLLVMPTYENTLLDQTYKTSVERQIEYGKQRGTPWGNSESGYNLMDTNSDYQYHAFGTPGLGLKRGLGEDLVIAPYATALALMVEPEKSCENLERMNRDGFEGAYGFCEAVDYTPSRLQRGQSHAVVNSYMAHHQGMSFLSLAYVLLNQPMQRRFEAEPQFQATLLLLQERIPKATSFYAHTTDIKDQSFFTTGTTVRVVNTPNTPIPEVQLLSNERYHVMITNAGGGYSRWKDLAVTRWREDGTCDNWGNFCYVRDLENNNYWSGTFQPSLQLVENYEAAFSQSRVDFKGLKNNIETHVEIVVSPEDDIEVRRLNISNHSSKTRTLEITSYAEVVLAPPASDAMQPAFSNLFVETEIHKEQRAIICTRRPRSSNEQPPWMFHLMSLKGIAADEVSYETDRMQFIGRGNTAANPLAMQQAGKLSGTDGSVLDPIVAIRYKITLQPKQTIALDMIIGIAETKDACNILVEKYRDTHHRDLVFELAWTHSQVVLRHINATESDAQLYCRLAGSIIFANASLRADSSILIRNQRGQSGLWGYSISGDLPIILLQFENQDGMELVKQLIQAHTFWRIKGLMVDLVIWNEDHGGYRQVLQNQIQSLIPSEVSDKPGGIFVRAADQISNEDRILFQTVSRVILSASNGTLEEQLDKIIFPKVTIPYINKKTSSISPVENIKPSEELTFFNGLGGFNPRGDEYVITVDNKTRTPAPWVNVIANPNLGMVISESGQAYTWAENAHEFRLTPWNNDPVSDTAGEAFYLRDEESGRFWSTSLLPCISESPYIVRHGMGYSVFEHIEEGIHSEMWVFVDLEDSIKYTVLKIRNISESHRKISATGYVEWVLGDLRTKTAMHIFSELDPVSGALLAKNPYNTEFSSRVAFFDVNQQKKAYTADRTEFIGRNSSLKNPDAMNRVRLSGKLGGGLDPCAAIQVTVELAHDEECQIVFRMGVGNNANEASNLAQKTKNSKYALDALEKVREYWKHTLSALRIETPDTSTNLLANGWLTYQTIVSRIWGRSGYYQSGGAFGFRDQLQDVISLFHIQPELGRKQILLSSSRQFKEGDVQHWWHPPTGRGVRTRCSDDYLWLPYVTSKYILQTNDAAILEESTSFLEGRMLNPGEESYYDLPMISHESATLYEHCIRAIRHGFRYGVHGLPLMGAGDWNDGMDRVGKDGKGESVWLGFFLYEVLTSFIEIAEQRNDVSLVAEFKKESLQLKKNIEKNGWDGEWYRRAYFDDGTPLGSSTNDECKIDSISQSWSVISGVGEKERSAIAMESAYEKLVSKEGALIRLLDPAFDKSKLDPGYIKGYVPGVRENGGQYTHAAIWMIIAFAKMGNNKRTWELLNLVNPINHGRTVQEIDVYKVEPYVIAGDVYGLAPHTGRGGWTWYSGSASWMYQLITEYVLGIKQRGDKLFFLPCIPEEWDSFKVDYRYKKTIYHLSFIQKKSIGAMEVSMNGVVQQDQTINMKDSGEEHSVEIILFSNGTKQLA